MPETTSTPPCHQCIARCCQHATSGWPFAAVLEPEEVAEFNEFATYDQAMQAYVLPYDAQGRCPYLGVDNLCSIHNDKPKTCRDFNCTVGHIIFLSRNPELVALLDALGK